MIKPVKCDAHAGVNNIEKKGGFRSVLLIQEKALNAKVLKPFVSWNIKTSCVRGLDKLE